MIVGHLDPVALEGGAHPLHNAVIHVPVVPRSGPHPHHIFDAAGTVLGDPDGRGRVLQDLRELGQHLPQRLLHRLSRRIVGGGEGQLHPPLAQLGIVDDLGRRHLAVGDKDLLVVHGGQGAVRQADGDDRAPHPVRLHIVPHLEGLGHQDHDAPRQVGEGVLERQGDSQAGHAEQGDHGGHRDAKGVRHHQDQEEPQGDPHHRADIAPH